MGIGTTESLLPYTVALIFYAGLMPIAGFYILRWKPRLVMTLSGLVLGEGYVLASIAPHIGTTTTGPAFFRLINLRSQPTYLSSVRN